MPNSHLQVRVAARRIVTRLAFTLAIFTLVITSGIFHATNVSAADGSLDTTFNPGAGANDAVLAVAIQPDGKVIIGGFFSTVNNVARIGITRLQDTSTPADIFIEGFIRRASGAPVAGVSVTLSGSVQAATTTDMNGHYRFSVPANAAYQVTAGARGIRFSPSTLTFGSSMVNQVGDFTALTIKGRRDARVRR